MNLIKFLKLLDSILQDLAVKMVVDGKDHDDPVGIRKKKAAMPAAAELEKTLKGFVEKEEKEKHPRCPCPYWLKDKTAFVDQNLAEVMQNS